MTLESLTLFNCTKGHNVTNNTLYMNNVERYVCVNTLKHSFIAWL